MFIFINSLWDSHNYLFFWVNYIKWNHYYIIGGESVFKVKIYCFLILSVWLLDGMFFFSHTVKRCFVKECCSGTRHCTALLNFEQLWLTRRELFQNWTNHFVSSWVEGWNEDLCISPSICKWLIEQWWAHSVPFFLKR